MAQSVANKKKDSDEGVRVTTLYIKITVTDPRENGTGDDKYTDYQVETKTNRPLFWKEEMIVRRRYTDFVWFRMELAKQLRPTLPDLPPKGGLRALPFVKHTYIFDSKFIEERRRGLERFLNQLVKIPGAEATNMLHTFLEDDFLDKSNFSIGFEPALIQPTYFIEIQVINPTIQHDVGNNKRFTDYEIRTKTSFPFFKANRSSVRRRYSDFEWLRNQLMKAANLPPLPPSLPLIHTLLGEANEANFDRDFIENRRHGLQIFLEKLVKDDKIQRETCLIMFLQDNVLDKDYYVRQKEYEKSS